MSSAGPALDGILLIDKEPGWTSHDVVAKLRGISRQRRIGHTGTLDPAATGLLVACLGRATRLVEFMNSHGKTYEGVIQLGVTTETDDAEGEVVDRRDVPALDQATLTQLEERFTGAIDQVPPRYSAVKVDGRRAYAVARKGGDVALEARPVLVERLRLEIEGPDRLTVEVDCGPGTYIRSLARDIGEALGCGGHLASLRRTRCGPFRVEQASRIGEVEELGARGLLHRIVLPADEGIADVPAALVRQERAAAFVSGGATGLDGQPVQPLGTARVYSAGGHFLGVGSVDERGRMRPRKVLFHAEE